MRALLHDLFASGGDGEEDKTKTTVIVEPPKPKDRKKTVVKDDDDDDDDDDFEDNGKLTAAAAGRKLRKLSRENARRRTENNELKQENEDLKEYSANLEVENKKAIKLQKNYDQVVAERDSMVEQRREDQIIAAINSEKDLAWHNAKLVRQQLKDDDIKVGEDGKVEGISEQLKTIAKEQPFLVKSADNDSGNQSRRTGDAPQSSATGNSEQRSNSDEEKMRELFPALNTL